MVNNYIRVPIMLARTSWDVWYAPSYDYCCAELLHLFVCLFDAFVTLWVCESFFFFFPQTYLKIAAHFATNGREKKKMIVCTCKGKTNICFFLYFFFRNLSLRETVETVDICPHPFTK